MLPDIASSQKIARALDLPLELVLRKARSLDPLPTDIDWLQRAIDDLANAVEAGQLSEEGRIAIVTHIRREQQIVGELRPKEQWKGSITILHIEHWKKKVKSSSTETW